MNWWRKKISLLWNNKQSALLIKSHLTHVVITVIWPTTFNLIIQSYLYMVFVYERIIFNLLISLCFINEYKQWIYVSRYDRVQLGSGDVGQTRFHLRLGFRSTMMSSPVVENGFFPLTFIRVHCTSVVSIVLMVYRGGERVWDLHSTHVWILWNGKKCEWNNSKPLREQKLFDF